MLSLRQPRLSNSPRSRGRHHSGVSIPWKTSAFEDDLRHLFELVRQPGAGVAEVGEGSLVVAISPSIALSFEGEALLLLRKLQRTIVGRSRSDVGLSSKDAETLLIDACGEALYEGGADAAMAGLLKQLEQPLRTWTIVEPLPRFFIPRPRLKVGNCTYVSRLPRGLIGSFSLFAPFDRGGPAVYTTASARDARTARVIALEAFADSNALLDLIDPREPGAGGSFLARDEESRHLSGSVGSPGWIIGSQFVGRSGLVAPYGHVSRALRKPEQKRTDWERRVVAATRWWSRASRSVVPADRLVSLMVALEALFIRDQRERRKGKKERLLARRLSERIRWRSMSYEEQVEWIEELYRSRSDAVHEGWDYAYDLYIDRLADITRYAISLAAHHLVDGHAEGRRKCRTFARAMSCPLWHGRDPRRV